MREKTHNLHGAIRDSTLAIYYQRDGLLIAGHSIQMITGGLISLLGFLFINCLIYISYYPLLQRDTINYAVLLSKSH